MSNPPSPANGPAVDENFEESLQSLLIKRDVYIDAPVTIVFEATLDELGPGSQLPDGQPFPMKFEPWPGGRWYRDLGNNSGHLWGHVQVIKPPRLLELTGPMFMSYPAMNFVQYRLTQEGKGTRLAILHRAMGYIPAEHRANTTEGWEHGLKRIAELAHARAAARSSN